MVEVIKILRDTPLPSLLVIGGIIFLLIPFVKKIGGAIEVETGHKINPAIIGLVLLITGISLYVIPALSPNNENKTDIPVTSDSLPTKVAAFSQATETPKTVGITISTVTLEPTPTKEVRILQPTEPIRVAAPTQPIQIQPTTTPFTQENFETQLGRCDIIARELPQTVEGIEQKFGISPGRVTILLHENCGENIIDGFVVAGNPVITVQVFEGGCIDAPPEAIYSSSTSSNGVGGLRAKSGTVTTGGFTYRTICP